jgi:hypothetical protein
MRTWPAWTALALGLGVMLSGCKERRPELLVSYSGDCQAYIEPCG